MSEEPQTREPVRRRGVRFNPYLAIPVVGVTGFGLWELYRLIEWASPHLALVFSTYGLIIGALVLGFVLVCRVPWFFKGWVALAHHRHNMRDRDARRQLLLVSADAMREAAKHGHNTEMSNTVTGDVVKTFLPTAPAARTVNNYGLPAAGEATVDSYGDVEEEQEEVEQPTVEQLAQSVARNSYQLPLGRSLFSGDLIVISIFKHHLKLIGASQKGKSAMAAAIMDLLTKTHDPAYLQLALLDLEDRTCHLFEDLPHIACYEREGDSIPLIARSREQVADILGLLVGMMNERATFPAREIKQMPILVVYLEELIALKDYFKTLSRGKRGAEKAQAEQAYATLMYNIGELARRGLKYRIQLLACTQCDYRDEDLVEAWVNIGDGLSFCVRPSAASAAGFRQTELLNQNYEEGEQGQFVCEVSGQSDIGIAPYYPLEDLLVAWEEAQEALEEQLGPPSGVLHLDEYVARSPRRGWHDSPNSGELGRIDSGPLFDSPEAKWDAAESPYPTGGLPLDRATRPEMPVSQPLVTSGDSPHPSYPTLSDPQVQQFLALYPTYGIEKSLDQIKGASHKHRDHARALVRHYNLQREPRRTAKGE